LDYAIEKMNYFHKIALDDLKNLPDNEYKKWLKEAKVKFAKTTLKEINKYALLEKIEVKEIK
jgi:hypothetical protein